MHILVTGYNGFIGKNLVERLRQENWQIDGWDMHCGDRPKISKYNWVIHLGACTDTASTDIEYLLKQNLEFSQWLFSECKQHEVNLQFASTSEVYDTDFSEYAALLPKTPYAWSKMLFDRWVFQQEHTALVQGFRYFSVYGKYQHVSKTLNYIEQWQDQAKKFKTINIPENAAHAKRDFVLVSDICEQHVNFIKSVNGSGVWNLGTGHGYNLLSIAELIADQHGATIIADMPAVKRKEIADLTLLKQTAGKIQWADLHDYLGG